MIFVPLPDNRYDCLVIEPVQWQWRHKQDHMTEGTVNSYEVYAIGAPVRKGTGVPVYSITGWIKIRRFLSPDDASQFILDMQEGRWQVEQAQEWSPGRGSTVVGERVETVADLHVSRVVRGAGRSRYRRKR